MKVTVLLLSLFFSINGALHAGNLVKLRYILPQGNPYSRPGIYSNLEEGILLEFGEVLHTDGRYTVDGIIWHECEKDGLEFYIPDMHIVHEQETFDMDGDGTIKIGYGNVDRGKPLPLDYRPDDLVPVLSGYKATGYEWREMLLRREAVKVFERLIDDAEREGVSIRILSAFRDAEYQAKLYARALVRRGLLQNSVAKPGHSEHQLGTVCDLTSDEIESGLSAAFENTLAYRWLVENIDNYGIFISYPKYKVKITGYIYEPWHYRYMGRERWLALDMRIPTFYAR
jgi:hypothetical protein